MRYQVLAKFFDVGNNKNRGGRFVTVTGTMNGEPMRAFLSGPAAYEFEKAVMACTPSGSLPGDMGHVVEIEGTMRESRAGSPYVSATSMSVLSGPSLRLYEIREMAQALRASSDLSPEVLAFLDRVVPIAAKFDPAAYEDAPEVLEVLPSEFSAEKVVADMKFSADEMVLRYVDASGKVVDDLDIARGGFDGPDQEISPPLAVMPSISMVKTDAVAFVESFVPNDGRLVDASSSNFPEGTSAPDDGGLVIPSVSDFPEGTSAPDDGGLVIPSVSDFPEGTSAPDDGGLVIPSSSNFPEGTSAPDDGGLVIPSSSNFPEGTSAPDDGGLVIPSVSDFPEGTSAPDDGGLVIPSVSDFPEGTSAPDDGGLVNETKSRLPEGNSIKDDGGFEDAPTSFAAKSDAAPSMDSSMASLSALADESMAQQADIYAAIAGESPAITVVPRAGMEEADPMESVIAGTPHADQVVEIAPVVTDKVMGLSGFGQRPDNFRRNPEDLETRKFSAAPVPADNDDFAPAPVRGAQSEASAVSEPEASSEAVQEQKLPASVALGRAIPAMAPRPRFGKRA